MAAAKLSRRLFLTALGSTLLLPERTIFLPPAGGWHVTPLRVLVARYADLRRPVGLGLAIATHSYARYGAAYLVTEHLRKGFVTLSVADDLPPALERHARAAALERPPYDIPTLTDLMPGSDELRWAARTDFDDEYPIGEP